MENENIGILAGKVWTFLSEHGPADGVKIRGALGVTNSQLFLALGWLAREEKVSVEAGSQVYTAAIKNG